MRPPVVSTRLTEMFETRHPIAVGGMMWLSKGEFVAACARAGVMAFVTPRSYGDPAAFREGLARAVDLAEGNPVGVNLTIPRYSRGPAPNREYLRIAQDLGVRMFETAGSHPGELIERIHEGGGRVIHKATQFRHALAAERDGADAVTIVGMESGGHPGLNPHPSPVLLNHLMDRIRIPMAVGGGLGTGRQLAGMLAQGAEAVVMGTRFLVAEEIWAHDAYKRRLVESGFDDTCVALASVKATWRVLDNVTSRRVREMEKIPGIRFEDFGEEVRGNFQRDVAYVGGNPDLGMLSCSSAVGFADRVEPAEAIVDRIMEEAKQTLDRLAGLRPAPARPERVSA